MPTIDNTILVTGAAGFIGSHVCDALRQRGGRVIGVDNFDPLYDPALKRRNLEEIAAAGPPGAFEFVEADVLDARAMKTIVESKGPRSIIHLAARAGVRPSLRDPAGYMRTNVEGTAVILEAARAHGVKRLVVASSSSVYGNSTPIPFREDADAGQPISPYAASKRATELICGTFHHLYGIPIACMRFFTVYGPRQRPDLAIGKFMRVIARDEPDTLLGDGSQSRDFTYVADIAAGVLAALDRIDRFGYRVWNLGHAHPVTVREMIDTIARVVGKRSLITPGPPSPGDVERTFADLSRSRTELGYEPKTDFEAGVGRQWSWMKNRPDILSLR